MTNKRNDGESSTKLDRKTVEKNRRIHMKSLCSKLVSLVPSTHFKAPKEMLSQINQLDHVISYVNEAKERVEKLKEKKKEAEAVALPGPVVELRDFGNIIEVMAMSELNRSLTLRQIISVVEEEGGQVVSASFCTVADKIFHTLHIEPKIARLGVETSRLRQRLQKLDFMT